MAIKIRDEVLFGDVDSDGDVLMEIETSGPSDIFIHLTQVEIKEIIEHLQKQILTR